TETSLPFDGLMYRDAVVVAVKLKKVRYSPGEDFILEKKFPGDVEALRALPLLPSVSRELWLRTQNERAFRRFWIIPGPTTVEIQEVTRDGTETPIIMRSAGRGLPTRPPFTSQTGERDSKKVGRATPGKPRKMPGLANGR